MNDRLFINGLELDINPLKRIAENYQINDLFDFANRQTSFTNTFSIPKSDRNIDILQGLGLVGGTSNIPYELNTLTYFRDGIQVFSNATAIIKETEDDFKCNAYFGNNNLFDIIENKKLSELNLSQFDHVLNADNFFKYLNGTDMVYALGDYSQINEQTIDINYQVPSIRTAWIWNKIFAEAGFTYKYAGRGGKNDYNVFLSDLWNETYITIDNGLDTSVVKVPKALQLSALNEGTYEYKYSVDWTSIYFNRRYFYIPKFISEPIFFKNSSSIKNSLVYQDEGRMLIIQNNWYSIDIKGNIVANAIQELELVIKKNNLIIERIPITEGIFNVNFSKRYYLQANDIITFSYEMVNENNTEDISFSPRLDFEIYLDNQEPFINFSNYWNNISQKDFLKDLVNFFGLTYKRVGNEYQFISYEELFNANAQYENFNPISPTNFVADDWSDKFNRLIKEEYSIGDYSQRNIFKYKYDNNQDNYADGILRINDFTLPFEKLQETRLWKVPNNSIFGYKSMPLYKSENGKLKNVKSDPFIFKLQRTSGSFDWKVTGGETKPFPGNYTIATFEDLSWSEQLGKILSLLGSVLNRVNKKDVELTLNELDIKELDFFKLKYIKQLGGYYYLLKVNGFSNNETTKCELLRVPQYPNGGQFSDDYSDEFKN